MENIIEQLRDDSNYYGQFGKQFLSNSDIMALLTNPRLFGKDEPDEKVLAEGRLFHQIILEPKKAIDFPFVECSNRNTKIYKDFLDANSLEFAMLSSEIEAIQSLTKLMTGNIAFFEEIYRTGNLYEEPAVGEIKGLMWKGKADIVTPDYLIDLKTTSDILSFRYSAKKYNYDSQCYIYQQLFKKPLIFYVIDKNTGQLGIFRPSDRFVAGGEFKVEKAIEVYLRYFGPNPTDDILNYYIDEILD